jgi:hypothetical protein
VVGRPKRRLIHPIQTVTKPQSAASFTAEKYRHKSIASSDFAFLASQPIVAIGSEIDPAVDLAG